MNKDEHIKLELDMYSRDKEEVNEMFNSGVFNEIVLGAIKCTLENLSVPHKDIEDALWECENNTFDQYNAQQLRDLLND